MCIRDSRLLPEKALPWVPWGAVLLGTAGALALFPALGTAELWNRRLVPAGNLILGLLLPALLWAGKTLLTGRKRNGISCREKAA